MLKDSNANIFNDFATLIEAGISITAAAKKVAASHPNLSCWPSVIGKLEQGNNLSASLEKSGLINRYQREIISVAEYAGRVSEGLRSIADAYDRRRSRISRLKSKLYYPFAILLVGIIVSAILQIARNPEISKISVIASSFLWVIIAIVITRTIPKLLQKDACYWLNLASKHTNNEWYKMQFQQVVFGALLWHNSSGIDFKTGFHRVSKLINNKSIRKKLMAAGNFCGQGNSITSSIRQAQLPLTSDFLQILMTAEQSGSWEESVKRYLQQNEQELDLKIDNTFEWAPRIYYTMIVLIAIGVIL